MANIIRYFIKGTRYLFDTEYRKNFRRRLSGQRIEAINDISSDKNIIIIQRNDNHVGTFSDYIVFLSEIESAISRGKIPVIDRMTYKTLLLPVDDNVNTWELFFQQPCGISLDNIDYKTMKVDLCHSGSQWVSLLRNDDKDITNYWRLIAKKYIRFNENLQSELDEQYNKLLNGKRVLGVSIREGYQYDGMRAGHPVQASLVKYINDVKVNMDKWNCEYVFFTCQTNNTVKEFKKIFGDKCICIERERLDDNGLMESNFWDSSIKKQESAIENEKKYINEMYLLSKCTSLICSENSGSEAAFIMSDGFEHFYCYDLGKYK